MECLRTDAMLMEILEERKTITGFLDAIFGFLRRHSDFYHVKRDSADKVGFAKGVREQILFGAMQRYDPDLKLNSLTAESSNDAEDDYAPPAVSEVEIETEVVQMEPSVEEQEAISEQSLQTPTKMEFTTATMDTMDEYFAPTDYKNGACFHNYCWSQTLHDAELHVKLPATLRSAKALKIEIKPERIAVCSRLNPEQVIINGRPSNRFKHNDTVWTITEDKLLISLDKSKELWWERFFESEQSIDLKKLDCERYIDELPEDSQAVIHKLRVQQMEQDMGNQQQVATAGANETMERLRQAWDAEGSPFKGQPFDPSVINFN